MNLVIAVVLLLAVTLLYTLFVRAKDIPPPDPVSPTQHLDERKAVWEASKEIGPALKPNLVILRDLRNGVAKEMQYPDYFSLEVAAYGMTTNEMLKMLDDWMSRTCDEWIVVEVENPT